LNLSKIKAEASEDKKLEEITAENHKKITDGVAKHRKDLKEWFISLFPGENIESDYVETSVLFDGDWKVTLALQLMTKAPEGNLVQVNTKANFMFKKTKNERIIASAAFIDETDYLNLEPESKDYKYSYTVQDQTKYFTFAELEQFVQYVIDK
ncbi:TPA: hypothetical protein OXO22_003078, partial [Acinetobacter baumannii]|nr:hypothetical protein [Acinetobacter baumannii]